jgi:hypothetical protein
MNKKILSGIILVFIVAFFVIKLSNSGTVVFVTCKNNLMPEKVTVVYKHSLSPDSCSFYGGGSFYFTNNYGENDFKISYNDSISTIIRHFKTSNENDDIYTIDLFIEENQVYTHFYVKGDNSKKMKKRLVRETFGD